MAVVSTPMNSAVVLAYQTGVAPGGGPILRTKTLGNIKADATEQAVFDVARVLFGLSQYPLMDTVLRRNYNLTEEV